MQPLPYCPLLQADPLSVVEYTLTVAAQTFDPTFERAIKMEDTCRGNVQIRPNEQVVWISPRWVVQSETVALVHEIIAAYHRCISMYASTRSNFRVPHVTPDRKPASFFRESPKKSPALDPSDIPPEDIVAWYRSHIEPA
jgi:hypothetical protein